jgi:hypothetical protein
LGGEIMNAYAQGVVILVQVDDNIEIKPERVCGL